MIAEKIAAVVQAIEEARRNAPMAKPKPKLVAVSKTHGQKAVIKALEAGQRIFGENRVQEAQAKFPALKTRFPDLELHLIGPLQSNKCKEAVALFDVIQSVDRPKLVTALAREIEKQQRSPRCFVQVNTGAEEQKAGVSPRDLPALLQSCSQAGLRVEGLMCIPPAKEEPSLHFSFLYKLAHENLTRDKPSQEKDPPLLSMGMSGDFELAVRFGADYVRVGSRIFGEREYP